MELFLIIIIIILAYLLFKGKNPSGEKIKKETKKYGKALKEAASTFQKAVQEEDKISKEDLDNLSDSIKVGVVATTEIITTLLNPLKDDKGGKFPSGFWEDEYIIGFIANLISFLLEPFILQGSKMEKGIAVSMVYEKLCPGEGEQRMKDFNYYAFNPTENSKLGFSLSTKLIAIVTNKINPKLAKDSDILAAKKLEKEFKGQQLAFGDNGENTGLATAFWEIYFHEYVDSKFI